MITLESHTATCEDCWARGDRRISEEWVNVDPDCESDTDRNAISSDDEDGYLKAEVFLCSRPSTPQLYYEIHSALCPVIEDNDFDLTRACDPVQLGSMGRDYRARRNKMTSSECLSDGESDGADSFASCEEYINEETPEEEQLDRGDTENNDVYQSMVGPHVRPKSPIKSLEDQSLLFYDLAQEYYPTE
ncbi:hypothetical protein N7457_003220 [Penicillium paradoxum]|uniref:uncharacterized protein n=1 Tax=Penicillium paradoxum TaxID=176176 RepID=UPI002548E31B|nr:uncharacterized protein N7457_003220 [Penicillium paradoxum]KAJ5788230.1 hypothetical protein N7457_003220 [Penicillium paradoxum]